MEEQEEIPDAVVTKTPIIPAEAEEIDEEDNEDSDVASEGASSSSTTTNHFQLSIDNPQYRPSSSQRYPTVREVLAKSPQLFSKLFPEAAQTRETTTTDEACITPDLQEQKPLYPLPSPHLVRSGRVVGLLGEDSASRRLVGRLSFESAVLLPSAFAEAEQSDEYLKPQQGVVVAEGEDSLPVAAPNVTCFFIPEKPHAPRVKLAPSSVPQGRVTFLIENWQ